MSLECLIAKLLAYATLAPKRMLVFGNLLANKIFRFNRCMSLCSL